jgi:hypothetical protein
MSHTFLLSLLDIITLSFWFYLSNSHDNEKILKRLNVIMLSNDKRNVCNKFSPPHAEMNC